MTEQDDIQQEAKIQEMGLTKGDRVSAESINALVKGCRYETHVVRGTCLTLSVAVAANGFTLGIGESVCVDPRNFNPQFGADAATRKAEMLTRDMLWQLEGWRLAQSRDPVNIARKCHELNRAYCLTHGDTSQLPWNEAPQWQRDSAINGVLFHIANPDAGPSASHENWLTQKRVEGWVYGTEKDEVMKTHPCMLPFDKLPEAQQMKDVLFKTTVDIELGRV